MEFLRRMLCFAAGFTVAASLVVMDQRMADNYGYESPWQRDVYARRAAFQVQTAMAQGKKLGEFYGDYFHKLADLAQEAWGNKITEGEEQPPRTIEAFHTQKL